MNTIEFKDAFIDACYKGEIEKVQRAIKAGADVNEAWGEGKTAICWSVSEGHMEVTRYLIEQGADVNFQEIDEGESVLIFAIQDLNGNKMVSMMNLLLDNGAKVELPDYLGWTPLFHATSYKSYEAVKVLLEYGANPDYVTDDEHESARTICTDNKILKLFS